MLTARVLWAPGVLLGQHVRHQLEGALRVGDSLLHGQELLLRGVDGSVLTQDVPVITGLQPPRRLQGKAGSSRAGQEALGTRHAGDKVSVSPADAWHMQNGALGSPGSGWLWG